MARAPQVEIRRYLFLPRTYIPTDSIGGALGSGRVVLFRRGRSVSPALLHEGDRLADISCTRCGNTRAGFDRPPFPGAIGARIMAEICQTCWGEWLKQQTMLINHYGLNVMDPQARTFLTRNMQAFLFKAGEGEDVDTTKKGTINW
jgi:Fe-S cluster biosynthesis and repair protein YggX